MAGCRSHGAERCWRHRVPSLPEGGPADMAAHGEGAGMGQRQPGEEEEREGGEKQQGEEAQGAVRQQKGAREGMGARGAAFVRGQGWGTGAEFSFLLCLKAKPCPVPPSAAAGGVNPCYPADKKREQKLLKGSGGCWEQAGEEESREIAAVQGGGAACPELGDGMLQGRTGCCRDKGAAGGLRMLQGRGSAGYLLLSEKRTGQRCSPCFP